MTKVVSSDIYTRLEIYKDGDLFKTCTKVLSGDSVAGFLVALEVLDDAKYYIILEKFGYIFAQCEINSYQCDVLLSNYKITTKIDRNIKYIDTNDRLQRYHWWIQNGNTNKITLYAFKTNAFVDTFVLFLNYIIKSSFKDYTCGKIYTYIKGKLFTYVIDGYY